MSASQQRCIRRPHHYHQRSPPRDAAPAVEDVARFIAVAVNDAGGIALRVIAIGLAGTAVGGDSCLPASNGVFVGRATAASGLHLDAAARAIIDDSFEQFAIGNYIPLIIFLTLL